MTTTRPAAMYEMLLTTNEVARFLRMDVRTLNNARVQHKGLPFVKTPTGGVRYRMSDLLEHMENQSRGFTEDRVADAIGGFKGLTADEKHALVQHLHKTVWHPKTAPAAT